MYQFVKSPDLPDSERSPYWLIRQGLFDCYYTYCRGKIKGIKKWGKEWLPNEHEIHWAYEQFELSYQYPVEKLMLEVLTLILNAGRGPSSIDVYHRTKIIEILMHKNLHEVLQVLPAEERSEFEFDLKLLDLI